MCALQLHNACPGAGHSLIRTVPPCTANVRCTLSTRIAAIVTAVQFRPMDRDRLTGANFLFSKRSPILVYQKLAEQTRMIMDELGGPADPLNSAHRTPRMLKRDGQVAGPAAFVANPVHRLTKLFLSLGQSSRSTLLFNSGHSPPNSWAVPGFRTV